jgi:uncharacterized protein (TIGR03083 family)
VLDLAAAYAETQEHLAGLVLELPASELGRKVPASPAWTVQDVVAHVTGVAADVAGGSVPPELDLVRSLSDPTHAARRDALTAQQVAGRRDHSLGEILEEWSGHLAHLLPMIRGERPFPNGVPFGDAVLVTDLAVHAQDVRGALDRPGDRESAAVSVALISYAAALGLKLAAAKLPALRLRYGDKERVVGDGEPAAILEADRYEIFRALAGRRSDEQILAMKWEGDPRPYVPLISAYGPRSDPIAE